jgi:hypothetical protein
MAVAVDDRVIELGADLRRGEVGVTAHEFPPRRDRPWAALGSKLNAVQLAPGRGARQSISRYARAADFG